ncbi:MAG: anthranilate synthase component I [candidate division KSB1 bacterium]|nr:anthranilate synthase component I [candidate division KSB1 bacterium]
MVEGIHPDYDTFARLRDQGLFVPVARRILADTETPVSAYLKIRRGSDMTFLLESVEGGSHVGRYSFLGARPFLVFRSWGDQIEVDGCFRYARKGDPISELRRLLGQFRAARVANLPRLVGGAVGFVAYEAVRLWERVPFRKPRVVPDMFWMFFDQVVAFDNVRREMLILTLAPARNSSREAYREALERIAETERLLLRPVDPLPAAGKPHFRPDPNVSRDQFLRMVERAKEYIFAGEAIQIVLSQRFQGEVSVTGLDLYRRLRTLNPSPYLFHLQMGDRELVGSSPEMLVRVEGRRVETRPIAGTRPRGRSPEEDKALEAELLRDEKERAEHLMLVDLGRNDLGRVCRYGSVCVPQFMTVERYSHVMHLVSSVEGELLPDKDALEALKACFPAGTVSGAPKVRAMEIIDELEPEARGVYAGGIGYLDFSGNMDTCIAIRTIALSGGVASVQVGAGIVADSDPEKEYEETCNKARALILAIQQAEKTA